MYKRFLALTICLLLLLAANVCCGSVFIDPSHWLDGGVYHQILFELRLPKALTAIVAGAALSVAGLMMQTLFRNPLAGPYILGISSGASLGVALTMLVPMASYLFSVASSAVAGATLVLVLMLVISRRVRDNVSLLIVGMMLGSIAGSLVSLLQNYANPDALKLFVVWTLGSVSHVGWAQLTVLSILVSLSLVMVVFLVKPLNALMLGEQYAAGLGVSVRKVRVAIVLVTGLLAGAVTAYCGPIAFVGVAVPHIARGLFATSNHRLTVPAAALIGANLLLLCNLLCSLFTYPLPISTMSALFGAPVIIRIILKK